MKKSIALLLILTLCLSLAACGKAGTTGNTDYDYIITLLDRGEYDMAIQIIEMLRSNGSVVPEETPAGGQSEPADSAAITSPGDTSFDSQAEIVNGADYRFDIQLINGTGRQLTLHSMKIVDYENGNIMGESAFDEKDYRDQNWYVLPPNTGTSYEDMHPYPAPFERRDYIFTYQDEDGTEYIADYIFQMQEAKSDGNTVQNAGGSPAVDYAQDLSRDLVTLRHGVGFQVEVRPGVYWVPANALGGSRYTNAEISQMLEKSPEEKQADVSTLYEALQLYQVGRFCSADDNICMEEDGIVWEHHKPGYDAVVTNCGCCATDSNWLHYILNGDYDEVGYIGMSQRDGNGHVINYILQDGWYYMIDLTHYRAEEGWLPTAIEDGDLNSYHNSDIIFGNIHKTRSLQDYVDYIQETFSDPPGLIERYTADDVPACACVFGQDGAVEILYAEMNNIDLEILFDDPADSLTFRLAPAPTRQPNWQ